MSEIRPIPPFKRFCGMLGAFPEAFSDSMTVYEALEWLYRYIDTEIVPKTNESIRLAEELKEYVEHYFDNLDVQEEINNKLDAMAESGQLQEVISEYLNAKSVLGFDSVADMKLATNLIDGSYARTLCFYSAEDRGGALYKIREIEDGETADEKSLIALADDNLVAELVEVGRMYVTQYGIKNDGSVDVTDDLQALIDAGKAINLVDGDYLIEGTLSGDYMNICGESQNSVLDGGTTKHTVVDASETTKTYLRNFACKKATVKVYGYNGAGGTLSEGQISDDRNIFVENIWFDEPLEGSGSTYWKLYIKTPKPETYDRFGHDGYACYPLEITNNSGYNALMINNVCTNSEGTAQAVSDNSAVGIIDKVQSSAPTVLIAQQAGRDLLRANSPVGYNTNGTTLHVNTQGHIAIGCTVPATESLPGYADIKIRDETPNIIFYSEHSSGTPSAYGLLQYGGNSYTRGFNMYIGGDEVLKACKGGIRPRSASLATIESWPAADLVEGAQVWDSTNHRPLWFNGTSWIDGEGTVVYTPA